MGRGRPPKNAKEEKLEENLEEDESNENINPDDPPKEDENKFISIEIWKIKKEIPDILFKTFVEKLDSKNEYTEDELDKKYTEFLAKKIN